MSDTISPADLLKPNELKTAPHARGDWFVTVGRDVPLERILMPGYWANHARSIKAGDKIEVVREDYSLDVTLRVIKSVPGLVTVRQLYSAYIDDSDLEAAAASGEAATPEPDVPAGYKLGFAPKGATPGHFVQLNATGDQVGKGMKTKREAINFAVAHAAASVTPAKQPATPTPATPPGPPDAPAPVPPPAG